jgi:two-component system response regulator AauR
MLNQRSVSRDMFAGGSPAIAGVVALANQVAVTDATVLILGETGTGKELLATYIHEESTRRARQLVRVNCAAIPDTLLESELFGREKGAFTGAYDRQVGRFELADRSTIFLDEIGDLPTNAQVKLLRVLEERQFERLGSTKPIRVDTRILTATHRNLEEAVTQGQFREDLFYRLNVLPIVLPPLRERREDILQLFEHFLQQSSLRFDRVVPELDNQTVSNLMSHDWPGNVRELRNVAERFALGLPAFKKSGAGAGNQGLAFAEAVEAFERNLLSDALQRSGGNLTQASQELGMAKTTLFDKVKKYGLSH